MTSLLKFMENERKRTGKTPSTSQLRDVISNRKSVYKIHQLELDDLYNKTLQYDAMQKAIEKQKNRLFNDN